MLFGPLQCPSHCSACCVSRACSLFLDTLILRNTPPSPPFSLLRTDLVRRTHIALWFTMAASLLLTAACGGDGAPSLSVRWQRDGASARPVLPSEAVQTAVYIENEGDVAIEGLVLRFDHVDTGMVPFGLSVGTATRVSSRFDGAAQVWDLGSLQPGQTMVFPIS